MELKYSGQPVGQMSDITINAEVKALLLRINVVTGWIIPEGPLQKALHEQFKLHLLEDYAMLNVNEIMGAFRQYGTTIKDWGKEMNLNLMDQVLIPFLKKRYDVSAMEEKIKNEPPPQTIYTDAEIDNIRRGELETAYQAMRKGKIPIIYDYYAELLVSDGFITDPLEINNFFVNSLNSGRENLYTKG